MQNEEHSEHYYITGAYNHIKCLSSFKIIMVFNCIEFPANYVCFLLFQGELKHSALKTSI